MAKVHTRCICHTFWSAGWTSVSKDFEKITARSISKGYIFSNDALHTEK